MSTSLGSLNVCNMQMQVLWRRSEMQARRPRGLYRTWGPRRAQCSDLKCSLGNGEEPPGKFGQEEKPDWEPRGTAVFIRGSLVAPTLNGWLG